LTGEVGSLLVLGDRLSICRVKSSDDQGFINSPYSISIGPYDMTATLSYTFTEFNLGGDLAVLNAGGRANIFTVDVSHSLFQQTCSSEFHLSLGGGILVS